MGFSYVILALTSIVFVKNLIKALQTKQYTSLLIYLLFIPFHVFFFSSLFLGGSAFHNAAENYDLYKAGHYYLCTRGRYTEVSHAVYLYVKIMEIIGLVCFGIGFILLGIKNTANKSNKPKLLGQR